MMLADLGADVIKVEHPTARTRAAGAAVPRRTGRHLLQSVNRNKRSVVLDMAKDDDRALAVALGRRADVIIENFRPRDDGAFGSATTSSRRRIRD